MTKHAENLAKLGWQYFECPACGSQGARGFPKPAQLPDDPQALKEATHIAEWLWKNFYQDQAPEWGVLPDLRGVLSQIDNMVAGFRDLRQSEWRGLTDDEVMEIAFNFDVPSLVVRTVEAKLKEKNA